MSENNKEDDNKEEDSNEEEVKEDVFVDANDHFVEDVDHMKEKLKHKNSNQINSETGGWFAIKSVLSSVTSRLSGQKPEDDNRVKEMIISIKDETKRELQMEEELDEELMAGTSPLKGTPEDKAIKLEIISGDFSHNLSQIFSF